MSAGTKNRFWTPEKLEVLRGLYSSGLPLYRISDILTKQFGVPIKVSNVRNAIYHYLPSDCLKRDNAREWVSPVFCSPHLPDDDYMICSDVHAPFHSELWLNRYLAVARRYGIKKQIITGDLLDFHIFSQYQPLDPPSDTTYSEPELEAVRSLLKAMSRQFVKSYHIMGNHERRIGRITQGKILASTIMTYFGEDYLKTFEYIAYDKVFIGDQWLVVHPDSYSQISGNVAFRLAAKFQRSVINAHGHFIAQRFDASGRHIVIDSGGLFDWTKIDYINLRTTTHPFWNNGFIMLRNGKVHLFHEFTDWDFYKVK